LNKPNATRKPGSVKENLTLNRSVERSDTTGLQRKENRSTPEESQKRASRHERVNQQRHPTFFAKTFFFDPSTQKLPATINLPLRLAS
jgi:hypothetical protein